MAQVAYTDEFGSWFEGLTADEQDDVAYSVGLLEELGVALPFPHSSDIKGARHALRELRCQSAGRPFRVIYAFNPVRDAVLILGGDKTGDGRFYERMVKRAENLWEQYLADEGWKPSGR